MASHLIKEKERLRAERERVLKEIEHQIINSDDSRQANTDRFLELEATLCKLNDCIIASD